MCVFGENLIKKTVSSQFEVLSKYVKGLTKRVIYASLRRLATCVRAGEFKVFEFICAYMRYVAFLGRESVHFIRREAEMKEIVAKAEMFREKIESAIAGEGDLLMAYVMNFMGYVGELFRMFRATQASGRETFHLDVHPQRLNEGLDKFRPLLQQASVQDHFPSIRGIERRFGDALDGFEVKVAEEARNRYTKSEIEYRFSQALYFDRFFSLIAILESFGGGDISDRKRLDEMAVEAATHIRETAASEEVKEELDKLIKLEIQDRLLLDDPLAGRFWKTLSSDEGRPQRHKRC